MPNRLYPVKVLAACLALLALPACRQVDEDEAEITVIGSQNELLEAGLRLSDNGRLVRAATAEGLVAFDSEGRVVPALAERWIVTDDGLSYIFRLRAGSDAGGGPISGEKARDALKQALAGLRGTSLALDLDGISEIRAMTGRVLEVRLSRPVPDLLDLLAQPELALLDRGRGTGPFQLRREKGAIILRPVAPEKRGLPEDPTWQETIRKLRVTPLEADAATKAFADGRTDIVMGGTLVDYGLGRAVSGISQRFLRSDAVAGLFGLVIVNGEGLLARAELREALAMAIDRDALAADLGIPGWMPTGRLVPATAGDAPAGIGERWSGIDMAARRATASQRLAKWTKDPDAATLRIALPQGPGSDAVFARLEADLGAVGLRLRRVAMNAAADLRLVDAVARYGRADWYLNQFACNAGRPVCSATADRRAADARAATDPAKRAELLTEAEAQLTMANGYIPLGTPVRWALVRDPQPGFVANPRGHHPLLALARRPK
ncbi:ABC transporter substrate-binding protein [Novosphingobium sp. TH158]|uniref:ABC transporter substrate-binding protein n=1 Tax=Novosphingobium sp. TH158 TaxID=2067455 RepID=UPI000C7E0C4E|nr:ABC transporter substrate-binding protein [Novosphingobium sp. TH158]PLK27392.1 ABC transporter substrate-binding protein [Novosphingobium sp. TH158]